MGKKYTVFVWKSMEKFRSIYWQWKVQGFNYINHLLLRSMQSFRNMILQKETKTGEKTWRQETTSKTFTYSWWFQPISKILVKLIQIGSFPQKGRKIKNIWNHHLDILWWCKTCLVSSERFPWTFVRLDQIQVEAFLSWQCTTRCWFQPI